LVSTFAKTGHKFDMQASSHFMPLVGMLESGGMINERAGPEHFTATIGMLLATAVDHKTEKGIDMPVFRASTSCGIVGKIDAEVSGRPTLLLNTKRWFRFELKQSGTPLLDRQ
jgi:hypothetical protein